LAGRYFNLSEPSSLEACVIQSPLLPGALIAKPEKRSLNLCAVVKTKKEKCSKHEKKNSKQPKTKEKQQIRHGVFYKKFYESWLLEAEGALEAVVWPVGGR